MSATDYAKRISFDTDHQVMEVDFSNLTLEVSEAVNAFYDEIERRLAQTGQKWFFLVNYKDCRIMSEAWIAFAYRGKKLNIAYSLGSVRFAAGEDTKEAILEKSKTEAFDPNLFKSRNEALEQLRQFRDEISDDEFKAKLIPTLPAKKLLQERIKFWPDNKVMEVDYSDFTFDSSSTVHRFYDEIESQVSATNQKWYFLVNYGNTEILPDAWYTWATRGKKLNADYSLGTVRFDPRAATKQEILKRARADEFNPNLVNTREEALARIEELRSGAGI